MKVYYVLSSEQFAVPELLRQGAWAEAAGFEGVWTSDHFQPWQPNEGHSGSAWVTLAALTQRTSRVAMGTGVTCPTFRYRPAVLAQAWASLSLLAPGRVYLGVGAGERLNEGAAGGGWGEYGERASRLVEAVKIIRALWKGGHVRLDGDYWKVDGRLYDPPASTIPLYIAAGGPKSAHLAGTHGDGIIMQAEDLRTKPELKDAWERASGGHKPIVVEHWAVVGGDRVARAAAEKWRFGPRAWSKGYFDNVSPESIQANAEREVGLEEVMKGWTVSEDPRDHTKAIRELGELGATHAVVHCPVPDQRKAMAFFGRRVLPGLRARRRPRRRL